MLRSKITRSWRSMLVLASVLFAGSGIIALGLLPTAVNAAPASPVDQTKVPHYFGPYPNYATSPQTQASATVVITGAGTGAAATATVDPRTGAVSNITVTSPGTGYTAGTTVSISGPGTLATATAVVDSTGTLTAITAGAGGAGYTAPVVTITGGGATTNATAVAIGSVDAVLPFGVINVPTTPNIVFTLPPDQVGWPATASVTVDASGNVTAINIVDPGYGYTTAPVGTIYDGNRTAMGTVQTTMSVTGFKLLTFGSGYTSAPSVAISDATGTGAMGLAAFSAAGSVTAINVTNSGSGYLSAGLKKFIDPLPGLCLPPACPLTGKFIPLGVANTAWTDGVHTHTNSDTYEIALVQYRMQFSSQLPAALVRGYVQLETAANAGVSQHFPLVNHMMNGTTVPVLVNGVQAYGVTPPQSLGPTIVATKDRPVRIVFRNLLPTGVAGDLFLPVDTTIMGSGMGSKASQTPPVDAFSVMDEVRNPMCTEGYAVASMQPDTCYTQNRATLHLHGGTTVWISDGTAHQWTTPAGEVTGYPQGVSVQMVPDMNVCGVGGSAVGCQTFYYTNNQSARLMFYHDHAWGITRLGVYVGGAAGYLITDATEASLVSRGLIPGSADTIPLIIQDKTFVPGPAALAEQDPTWDTTRWGGLGALWTPHVYMPAQNPGDPSGASPFGRWMYGPWFWPPATNVAYQPIPNPYYNKDPATNFTTALAVPCDLGNPATWQYQTDPFCEPALIPGTPNITVGMEAFNDTPLVNGTAYPTVTLQPKTYRLRILNAANDRFWNLQWYIGDPTTANPVTGATEVALNPAELALAQLDPVVFPTPNTALSPAGPNWIQIGTEGGFLPAPTIVPNQPTTWITDPTRFDVGNVDLHSLLLGPAERADVIVDFSQFAGKTLILYNDAPAAFPARVPGYDYYTGGPDLRPAGAAPTLPGYGPNTRTVMQVKIAAAAPAPAFNLPALAAAFEHQPDGSGVFESGQHPIIVGQAAYNSAYGTNFSVGNWCNGPGSTSTNCDGFARIMEGSQPTDLFGFNTLLAPTAKMQIKFEPKGMHDEMNSTSFDEYGRMQATMGLEAPGANPLLQNIILYPFVNPASELIDGTNLPHTGGPGVDLRVTPISSATDGTQIWKITHNGVDTHPIHFHLFDVQLINRVTWDNIIIPPEASEIGWKDTVRVSPLEDTIVALRAVIPTAPFALPNSVRLLNPSMPLDSTIGFNNVDAAGNPTPVLIKNAMTNFGHEYTWHCHILSHEEMDMMRPMSLAIPPVAPTSLVALRSGAGFGLKVTLTWTDNSNNETGFRVSRALAATGPWTVLGTVGLGVTTYTDPIPNATVPSYYYRVEAINTVGYTATPGYSSLTVTGVSAAVADAAPPPAAPTLLTATVTSATQVRLTWRDNATTETSFAVERSVNGGAFALLNTVAAFAGTGTVTYNDNTVAVGQTYAYRVRAFNGIAPSAYTNTASVSTAILAPTGLTGTILNAARDVRLNWTDNATNETSYKVERSADGGTTWTVLTTTLAANAITYTNAAVPLGTYVYRVTAVNGAASSTPALVTVVVALPAAPTSLAGVAVISGGRAVNLTWVDNANNETSFTIQRCTGACGTGGAWANVTTTVAANATTYLNTGLTPLRTYSYRIQAVNGLGSSAFSNIVTVTTL